MFNCKHSNIQVQWVENNSSCQFKYYHSHPAHVWDVGALSTHLWPLIVFQKSCKEGLWLPTTHESCISNWISESSVPTPTTRQVFDNNVLSTVPKLMSSSFLPVFNWVWERESNWNFPLPRCECSSFSKFLATTVLWSEPLPQLSTSPLSTWCLSETLTMEQFISLIAHCITDLNFAFAFIVSTELPTQIAKFWVKNMSLQAGLVILLLYQRPYTQCLKTA